MEYWYLYLILAVLIIVTAVFIMFAGRSLSSHNDRVRETVKELERLTQLKNKYKELTPEKVDSADAKELLEGLTAVMQSEIEKSEDASRTFSKFDEVKKYIYALNWFVDSVSESLSSFFDSYTEELFALIPCALRQIGEENITDIVNSMCEMYDENNETVSFDKEKIGNTDKLFLEAYSEAETLEKIREYVKKNIDIF